MRAMDEDSALAVAFANTRRKKRGDDLMTVARCFEYLLSLYGSQKKVAERVGISTEMIRQFLIPLRLPKQVRNDIASRRIDSVDVVKEIAALKDPRKQIAAARVLASLGTKDFRDIKRLLKEHDLGVPGATKRVLAEKPRDLHLFVVHFDQRAYDAIVCEANKREMEPTDFIRDAVLRKLRRKSGKKGA